MRRIQSLIRGGKTTITNLINRFYEINEGSITYDGIDVKDIRKDDLRHSLSMVLQDTHLFTGTIEDNIRYGKLAASHDEVVSAAKLANAHSFIRRLPDGYHTMLHSDGANLSQGRTVFVIAHRLSTVRNANAIMVLENGKIIERGDHDELLEQKGKYYQLYHGMFELS